MSRSTSNKYDAGGPAVRLKRKHRVIERYRADVDALTVLFPSGLVLNYAPEHLDRAMALAEVDLATIVMAVDACRCYRCGELLTVETVTIDRIVPGCEGGSYEDDNVRPCCGLCNSRTGGRLGRARQVVMAS